MAKRSSPPKDERLRIWNALFLRAIEDASALAKDKGRSPKRKPDPKFSLEPEERMSLLLIGSCILAIEARCNHMIGELAERGRLSEDEAHDLQWLPARVKWFMLPRLAGSRKRFDAGIRPHQAIAVICSARNPLVHVNYGQIRDKIPSGDKALGLFRDFVEAMEELNVVVRRTRRARRAVRDLGVFE